MSRLLLILRLEGPLQSWGERARWDFRDTAPVPTKSGIIGLLGGAMGIPRNDIRLEQLEQNLLMGVRADKAGTYMEDYQTITGKIMTSKGKARGRQDEESKLVSHRQYLQDASFLVVLDGAEETLRKCADALRKPVWTIYLGRRCCVPTRPVFEELTDRYKSIVDALQNIPCYYAQKYGTLCEVEDSRGDIERCDRNVTAPTRLFRMRRAQNIYVSFER